MIPQILPAPTVTRFARTARIVGALFLAVFLFYGIGSSIATTAEPGSGPMVIGVSLMLLNSISVVVIGILLLPVLRTHSLASAYGYLATRVFEGVLLGAGAIALLSGSPATNTILYNIGMAGLGVGSVFFLGIALFRSGLVPRWLAAWGIIGYAIFATGSLLELLGIAGAGLVGAAPSGLFEVFFGIWLLVRRFGGIPAVVKVN